MGIWSFLKSFRNRTLDDIAKEAIDHANNLAMCLAAEDWSGAEDCLREVEQRVNILNSNSEELNDNQREKLKTINELLEALKASVKEHKWHDSLYIGRGLRNSFKKFS